MIASLAHIVANANIQRLSLKGLSKNVGKTEELSPRLPLIIDVVSGRYHNGGNVTSSRI